MNDLNIWIVKHKRLVTLLIAIPFLTAFTWAMKTLNAGTALIVICDVILYVSIRANASAAYLKPLKNAITALNEANDPYPLLELTEKLKECNIGEYSKLSITTNYCAALDNVGRTEENYNILSSLNVAKYADNDPFFACVYYHNLFSVCSNLERFEEAEVWYKKAQDSYLKIKRQKQKEAAAFSINMSRVQLEINRGNYCEALKLTDGAATINPYQRVSKAFTLGVLYMKLEEKEKAIREFNYCIAYGNRRYVVTEAKENLNSLV